MSKFEKDSFKFLNKSNTSLGTQFTACELVYSGDRFVNR